MKKLLKVMIPVILVIACMFTLAVTANAAGNSKKINLVVGETEDLGISFTPYQSSDPSVVEIRTDGLRYKAVAVGKGSAQIIGNVGLKSAQQVYSVTVRNAPFGLYMEPQDIFTCLIAVVMLLGFSCVGYIFYAAPKCGMSRWWAVAPLINNVLGLIVFIVVFTRKKNGRSRKAAVVITCPTCGGKHQEGAGFCSICGTKL